jgi:adenosylhomocysteinase
MPNIVHRLPDSADTMIASLKLKAMGITLDTLSEAQQHYLNSWQEGT